MKRVFVAAGERLQLLDATRGIASLAVAAFHIYVFSSVGPELAKAIPRWADAVLTHGSLGVDIFFVLSGLVIAASIAGDRITLGYLGRFALRRSIRLDPPYWATLVFAIALLALTHHPPSFSRVLAHIVYLQMLLGHQNIVSQFWTLTYEVQFYIVLIVMVMLGQRLGSGVGWTLAVVPLVASLAIQLAGVDTQGWFIAWWYAFALGVATTGMLTGRLSLATWGLLAIAVFGVGVATSKMDIITVVTAACGIGFLGRAGVLARWSGGRVLQWLGRRSYSLYLMHFLGSALAKMASPRITTPFQAAIVFALALAVSVVAAEALYRLVEAPAHRLSRSIGSVRARNLSSTAPAPQGIPEQSVA
jgi:peptidoglycan/LPS O-acetylase OafA/YrhL